VENGVLVLHDMAGTGGHQSNVKPLLIHAHDTTQSAYTKPQYMCKGGGWLVAPIAWWVSISNILADDNVSLNDFIPSTNTTHRLSEFPIFLTVGAIIYLACKVSDPLNYPA